MGGRGRDGLSVGHHPALQQNQSPGNRRKSEAVQAGEEQRRVKEGTDADVSSSKDPEEGRAEERIRWR